MKKKLFSRRHTWLSISLLAWGLTLIGYFSPWVGHRSAALAWNAYDLFDVLRPLPEIETGALVINLYALRLPLVGLAVGLPLMLAGTRRMWRIVAVFLSVTLIITTFPPYPHIVGAWSTPGWRVPFWWAVGGLLGAPLLAILAPTLSKWRNWLTLAWLTTCSVPALLTFNRLRPALQNLLTAPIRRGWGLWLYIGGFLVMAALAWHQGIRFWQEGKMMMMMMMNPDMAHIRAVKKRYERKLLRKANVVSVGIGTYDDDDDDDDDDREQRFALIVGVTHKVPLPQLKPRDRLPKEVEGVRVKVQTVGDIRSHT